MDNFFHKIKIVFGDKSLRNKILFVVGALVVFRLLAALPIPGVDTARLSQFLDNNQFFGVLNIFSGGGLSKLSIVMLGVGPYITGSIIMQLLTIMVPKLKALYSEEGEAGRKKFAQYSRMLTIPLAFVQGMSLLIVLEKQGILTHLTSIDRVVNISMIVAGSMLLMWIGELISEFGIGNGVSLLIFAGIVAGLPNSISQFLFTFDMSNIISYLIFALMGIVVIAGVVYATEAERPIPVTYAKRMSGLKTVSNGISTYIPMRINQSGVMPIIFALSILLFPQLIGNFLITLTSHTWSAIGHAMINFLQNGWLYGSTYFILVFLFTYFYTAVTFDPESMATNLQKNGAFIPGVRPGQATIEYVTRVLTRVTMVGALFLGIIAVLPLIMSKATGITQITLGGTALLIAVSVVIDLVKKVDAQISMREY